jgi:hypothetical protein
MGAKWVMVKQDHSGPVSNGKKRELRLRPPDFIVGRHQMRRCGLTDG